MPTKDTPQLERLETLICKGIRAYEERNQLIADLVRQGHKQSDIARRLNAVRAKHGAPQITPDAIAATLNRLKRKD
jgi:hypothetical protein